MLRRSVLRFNLSSRGQCTNLSAQVASSSSQEPVGGTSSPPRIIQLKAAHSTFRSLSTNRRNLTGIKYFQGGQQQKKKTALVLGSSGALGSAVSKHLSQDLGMAVVGADLMELPTDFTGDWELDGFIPLQAEDCELPALTLSLHRGVSQFLLDQQQQQQRGGGDDNDDDNVCSLDAIICASGGWQTDPEFDSHAGSADSSSPMSMEELLEQHAKRYAQSIDGMMQRNLYPVVASSFVAQSCMERRGLMVVIGATAALAPTPGMMGYGVSKAGAHFVTQTVGASTGQAIQHSSARKVARRVRRGWVALDDLTAVAILPTMLDTEANRRSDPKGKFELWTKPVDIAAQIGEWIESPALRPHSGSLVKVTSNPKGPGATFELVR